MNKEQQKKLLIEIIEADEKDGLYSDISKMETTQTDGKKLKSAQTAVEFLLRELRIEDLAKGEQLSVVLLICEQAKQMEKQQIMDARLDGFKISAEGWNGEYPCEGWTINEISHKIKNEQYYKETYNK